MAISRVFQLCHRFLLLGALVAANSTFLSAQIDTATMSGRVTDNTGAVVPGASVKIAHLATGRERDSVTNELGEFWVSALPVGAYRVTVTMPGFKQFVQEGIVLEVNRVARLNLRLDVGQLSENVVVTGDARWSRSGQPASRHRHSPSRTDGEVCSGAQARSLVRIIQLRCPTTVTGYAFPIFPRPRSAHYPTRRKMGKA